MVSSICAGIANTCPTLPSISPSIHIQYEDLVRTYPTWRPTVRPKSHFAVDLGPILAKPVRICVQTFGNCHGASEDPRYIVHIGGTVYKEQKHVRV